MPSKSRNAANLVSAGNLYVDIDTDYFGVGNSAPQSKLDVTGDVRVSGITTSTGGFVGNLTGTATTSTNVSGGIGSLSSLNVSGIVTAVTEIDVGVGGTIFTALSSGYVGVGVTNPTRRLNILGDSSTNQFNTVLSLMSTNTTGYGVYLGLNGSTITSGRNYRLVSSGTLESSGVGNFSIYDGTASLDRLIINSSGNVGLATTIPTSRLHVIGNTLISGVTTSSGGFVGSLSGTATTATNLADAANITTGTINSARLSGSYNINVSYANTAGISTVSQGLTGTPNIIVGVATASSFVGTATTANNLSNAANITTGTINSARLSGSYGIDITGTATTATNLSNAANITTGTINSARLSGSYGIDITGTATTATNLSNAANITTGTINSARLSGSYGIDITGTATTATNLSNAANITTGTISASRLSGSYNIDVTGTATTAVNLTPTSSVNTTGIITASKFVGDGTLITGIVAVGSGVQILSNNVNIGVAQTINFGPDINATLSSGIATVTTPIYWVRQTTGITTTSSVGIGTTNPTQTLHVQGTTRLTGGLFDSNNNVGAANSILTSTGSGVSWTTPRYNTMLFGSTINIRRANSTYFNYGSVANATESIVTIAMPTAGTISNLYVKLSAAAGAVGTGYTFTVRKNSAATGVSVFVSGTANSGSDLINNVSFNAGDTFSIEAKPTTVQPTDNLDVVWTARYTTT